MPKSPSPPMFHPDLRAARFLPRTTVGPRSLWLFRALTRLLSARSDAEVVAIGWEASVRVHRPPASGSVRGPALLWIHGGGYVMGQAAGDDGLCRAFARRLGIVVAAVDYRLAPEHPYPAPLEDCYSALRWLTGQPDVDAERIAVGGASAGGGLAAALALLARERGEIKPAFQLLAYPMLDDRTTVRTDVDPRRLRMWNQKSNRFGWRSYLGSLTVGGENVPASAAPARCEDLSGLPPAWIGVGTNDLFYDEDTTYARRLREAGVPCTLEEVPGAYHGFDLVETKAEVSRAFTRAQTTALADALGLDRPPTL